MTLEKTLVRRVVLLGAFAISTFAVITSLAAAQTPSPALLITVRGEREQYLAIADPLTMKVVGRVPIPGGFPHEVVVSDDGKLAFLTNTTYGLPAPNTTVTSDESISIIDLAAQKELRRVDTGPGSFPHCIVFVRGKLYFTAEGYKLVGRYDLASNRIDWMMGTGQHREHMLVVTKDGNKIFTANTDSNTVSDIVPWDSPPDYKKAHYDPPPRWNVTTIPVGFGPEGIALSRDEKEVWALTRGDGSLSIIDAATKKVSQTLTLSIKVPHRLQFTPDGKRVVISDGESGEVLLLDAVTHKELKRIKLGDLTPAALKALKEAGKGLLSPAKTHGVLISPDGSRAYVTITGSNYVAIIDLRTFESVGSIPTSAPPEGMAWVETK